MSGEQGHGVRVETDSLRATLQPTRTLRQALDVLLENLPPGVATEAIRDALYDLDNRLSEDAHAELRGRRLSRDYLVISPINPMNLPGPNDMEKVAAALRTLDDLGLIINL